MPGGGAAAGKLLRSKSSAPVTSAWEAKLPRAVLHMMREMAFKTTPEVRFYDPSLTMLNLALKLAIFIYIVVINLLVNKHYLECHPLGGTTSLHAKRVSAVATDAQCAAAGIPRTKGFARNREYFNTDSWCEGQTEFTGSFVPTNPHGRRLQGAGGSGDDTQFQCYKRNSGAIELTYDQVGAEIPPVTNHLQFRHAYGVTPWFNETRLAAYDVEGYTLTFKDLLVSTPFITASSVMADNRLGGNQRAVAYRLLDKDGGVVNTCSNADQVAFDWRQTCGIGPFTSACEFTESETMVLPVASLLQAAGVSSLDDLMSTHDEQTSDLCVAERLFRNGINSQESHQAAVENGVSSGSLTFADFEQEVHDECDKLTLRTASWNVFVVFECENMEGSRGTLGGPWNGGAIECDVHAKLGYRENIATETWGAEISVVHTGEVCVASFAALLLALTSSVPLLAASSTITNLTLQFIHPRKKQFISHVRNDVTHEQLAEEFAQADQEKREMADADVADVEEGGKGSDEASDQPVLPEPPPEAAAGLPNAVP